MPEIQRLTIEGIFSPAGRLSEVLTHFEHRPQQLEMARAAYEIMAGGGALLAEAGTGSGKTLGYLFPAVLSGKKTVISTGTKNLQEQIFHKDLPVVARIFPSVRGAYLKGRANYLCRNRLAQATERPFLPGSREARFLDAVTEWSRATETGDRAELPWLAEDEPLWSWVWAEREYCLAPRCPNLADCFITRARRRAAAADIIVLNHHLLLAEAVMDESGVGLLPQAENLVVDEAHLLEEVATRALGVEFFTGTVSRLLAGASEAGPKKPARGLSRVLRRGFALLEELAEALPPAEGSFPLPAEGPASCAAMLAKADALLGELAGSLEERGGESPEAEILRRQAARLASAARFIARQSEPGYVYWYERRAGGIALQASPVDVSGGLPGVLFDRFAAVVLTSATLAVGGSFRYLKERLGLTETAEIIADSPFDFGRQAVLYVPEDMPQPNSPEFIEAVARNIIPLLEMTGGRAFVLCTSRRSLELIQATLKRETSFRVLRQGDAPRSALLAEFTSAPRAVLVATTSFWQGVDVPGEALSAVIIDRLPFASPDDPLTAGRIKHLREQGKSPFHEYQLPAAVIMLKQGLGRLIRRRTDRGLLAVMDTRIYRRNYGKTFLRSLPPMKVVRDLESLEDAYLVIQNAEN